MATVTIQAVSKAFGELSILQNIDLKIEKGEFVVIVGPSGCGKSTLLRLIAGLDMLGKGSILINDQCVNSTPASSRDIAMVFQNYALYPHMTVYDNMAYALKMRRMNKLEIKNRVEKASELLQLTEYLQRKPNELSGGQRQRVAMGRAIVRSPAVFLFDEPLSNLDFKLRTEMRHEIKKLHKKLNATCIYVTHDQTEAMTMADRVVVLNKGRIEQVGSPRDVYEYPASKFVASFLGHFPMNFISGTLDFSRNRLLLSVGLELPLPQLTSTVKSNEMEMSCCVGDEVNLEPLLQTIVLGIRPEHLTLASQVDKNSFSARVDYVDDMGSDKLVRVITDVGGEPVCIRLSGDFSFNSEQCFIKVDISKAMIFSSHDGKRLGGWGA